MVVLEEPATLGIELDLVAHRTARVLGPPSIGLGHVGPVQVRSIRTCVNL